METWTCHCRKMLGRVESLEYGQLIPFVGCEVSPNTHIVEPKIRFRCCGHPPNHAR